MCIPSTQVLPSAEEVAADSWGSTTCRETYRKHDIEQREQDRLAGMKVNHVRGGVGWGVGGEGGHCAHWCVHMFACSQSLAGVVYTSTDVCLNCVLCEWPVPCPPRRRDTGHCPSH